MTWAIFRHETQLHAVGEILETDNERVIAVVGGALLDAAVTRTLRERLRLEYEGASIDDRIFQPSGPLGNVDPKIDMLYLLHGIDEDTHKALRSITRIRNHFAHNLGATFDPPHPEHRAVQRCSDFFICEDVIEAESAVP